MQKFNLKVLLFTCLVGFLSSCEGEIGPTGPAGPVGAAGAPGVAGPVGKNGNANVIQINYPTKTHNGTADLVLNFPAAITLDMVDKSLFYTYLKKKVKAGDGKEYDFWFAVPGETNTGNEYSYYLFAGNATLTPGMYLRRVVNYISGPEAFDAVRVLVIPASETVTGGRKAAINYSDYNQVREAYNLSE